MKYIKTTHKNIMYIILSILSISIIFIILMNNKNVINKEGMHNEASSFCNYIQEIFPNMFSNVNILEVGSGDINGSVADLFDKKTVKYQGNDIFESPRTTIVNKTSTLPFADNTFDVIFSTECFEHDPEYVLSLQKIIKMLKPNGLFFFTCASTGRPEHGTRKTTANDSYGTIGGIVEWSDYYKNLTIQDIENAIDLSIFSQYAIYYNNLSSDLYFWGIKSGTTKKTIPKIYTNEGVTLLKSK